VGKGKKGERLNVLTSGRGIQMGRRINGGRGINVRSSINAGRGIKAGWGS